MERNSLFFHTDLEIIKMLINFGLNKNNDFYDSTTGETILFHQTNLETIKFLLKINGIKDLINQVSSQGKTALFSQKSPQILKLLLDSGMKYVINQITNDDEYNALSGQINSESAKILIDSGIKLVGYLPTFHNSLQFVVENEIDFSMYKILEKISKEDIIFLLEHGYDINNISPLVRVKFLKDNGHDQYLHLVKDENYEEQNIQLNLLKTERNWRAKFIYACRYYPKRIPVNKLVQEQNLEMLSILFYNNIYPEIKITDLEINYKLNSIQAIRLFVKLNLIKGEIVLININNLSDRNQELLNNIVAPAFIRQLYYHPYTQKILRFKKEENINLIKDENYFYYYENAKKLFDYLSEEEILSLLDINLTELYRYRLRKNYFDNRTLKEILNDKELPKISLWNLLFEEEKDLISCN